MKIALVLALARFYHGSPGEGTRPSLAAAAAGC